MKRKGYSVNFHEVNKPRRQRALVLQGGGTLGAYEAGVIEVLCKKLSEEDKEKNKQRELLFDIVAGTSIGAMNAAILVSNVVNKHKTWKKAAEMLRKFWTDRLAVRNIDISKIRKPWYDKYKKGIATAASEEAARRYYSVKSLLANQVQNNMYSQCNPPIKDVRFFDTMNLNRHVNCFNNDWILHSTWPLRKSIQKYGKFPIATEFSNKQGQEQCQQPRLLIFSVDVAEGVAVTFDSYPKADGSRRSEYGEYDPKIGYQIVIRYDHGINIGHVMASGTVPEFYSYAQVPIIELEQNKKDTGCKTNKSKDSNIRYFWDGGWLSNTPLRELLEAHRQYWTEVDDKGIIPDLEVYIVNIHTPKMDINILPEDYDGVKDRSHDILYGDRSSHYDEKLAHIITDYANFCTRTKDIVEKAIRLVTDEKKKQDLKEELDRILTAKTISRDSKNQPKVYKNLILEGFDLKVALRIERTKYSNSISNKTGDLTLDTINMLIKEGKCDAWLSIIQKDIVDMKESGEKDTLVNIFTRTILAIRKNDYQNDKSEPYDLLAEFINQAKIIGKLKAYDTTRLVKYAQELKIALDQTATKAKKSIKYVKRER